MVEGGGRIRLIDWDCPLEAVSLPLPHVLWLPSTLGLFWKVNFYQRKSPRLHQQRLYY